MCPAGASENTKGHGLNHGTVKQSALTVPSQMCSWPCHVDNQIPTPCQVLACQTTEFKNKTFMINFLICASNMIREMLQESVQEFKHELVRQKFLFFVGKH